jgi:hypothetical protein
MFPRLSVLQIAYFRFLSAVERKYKYVHLCSPSNTNYIFSPLKYLFFTLLNMHHLHYERLQGSMQQRAITQYTVKIYLSVVCSRTGNVAFVKIKRNSLCVLL